MKEQFLNLTGLTELVGYLKTSIANHKEILPYASNKLFPSVGDINTIYINTATNTIYRWDSSSKTYITLAKAVKSVAISEATENGKITLTVDGNKTTVPIHGLGSAAYTNSSAYSPAGHTHTKAQVGLGNVDNTADANKSVKHATTADSATKATKDSDNQQINTTYIKGLSVSGKTITYTKGNGSTGTITTQDTVYSHPNTSGNKHIPSGGSSGQILRWSADGTAAWGSDNNTTYSTGTASASGITKLYTGTGSATDGTMTQSAITSALNGKSPTSHTHNYAGSSSSGGAANSANKLATARTINGTNFDGSGNITTSSWGTARNVTVGGTTKSVNGSGNVSWSLAEIGIHLSTTDPTASDGKNGDIWITYE